MAVIATPADILMPPDSKGLRVLQMPLFHIPAVTVGNEPEAL
jgi:hypothetical protein